jgi:hypothetical protein
MPRFIKPKAHFKFTNERGIESLRSPVNTMRTLLSGRRTAQGLTCPRARDAFCDADPFPSQLRDGLFHRPTRGHLNNDEIEQHNPE